ncbi:hypothetical protein K435DRAFT_804243 [Dendrothele bispora CBS 962.96]|uniref:DUF6534 domain-containing protein n=1 Tax=Dendrothele bispora (strain CBS 962.96) TaxID=1314807 RepID=A0A4S8LEX2_DENBC|nr:hypothetical protein K435DRAFT_804243 [Dendrothele bispora CBS 962.96]
MTALTQLCAYLFQFFLYGVLIVQIYMYYCAFPKDRIWQKYLVFYLFSLCTLQSLLNMQGFFVKFGSGFGDQYKLMRIYPGGYCSIFITGIAQMGAALFHGARAIELKSFTLFRQQSWYSGVIWYGTTAVCDVLIACIMSFYLSRADMVFKHRHGRPLRRLMLLIIETGAASATLATTGTVLLCIGASPFDQISQRSLGIFYSNTILVIFNSRMRMKNSKEDMQLALAVSFAVEEGLGSTTLNAETRTAIPYEGPAEPIISSRFERFLHRVDVTSRGL